MGFDVGKAMQGLDKSSLLASSHALGLNTAWQGFAKQQAQQRRDLFRLSGLAQIDSSGYGALARNFASLKPMGLATNKWKAIGAIGPIGSYKTAHVSGILKSTLINPETTLAGVANLNYTLASVAFRAVRTQQEGFPPGLAALAGSRSIQSGLASLSQPRIGIMPILGLDGVACNIGLATSIAKIFRSYGLDGAYGATWNLRRGQVGQNYALRSILKTATTFGPILVPPDYDDAPFDYNPNLQGLIPETATESRGPLDIEELWAEAVAIAVGIAQHHHSKVFIRGVGKDGRSFLVQVAGTVVGGLILYWILHS